MPVLLIFLILKASSGQFGTWCFAKMFLYIDILTISPILYLGSSFIIYFLDSIYVLGFTSTGFVLIVLWYVLLYLLTISSNLWIYTFFDLIIMCWIHFYVISFLPWFYWSIIKFAAFINLYFVFLSIRFF